MKKVTCWYVKNADGSWSYNHLSDGWYVDVYPRTKNPVQRMNWKKRKWKQAYAYMDSKGLVSETAFRMEFCPGKNTGVGCPSLLQGIFLTQGLNLGLLHCRWILYHLSHGPCLQIYFV